MIFNLFDFFKNSNIEFCVMNGYEELIDGVETESDIDLLFKKKDFKDIEKILENFCKQSGMIMVQRMHHGVWAKNFFLFYPKEGKFLNLDLYAELSRKNIVYFNEEEVFLTLKDYKGFPILGTEKEFLNYFIKKIDKNELTENVFHKLKVLYDLEKKLCQKSLSNFFPLMSKTIIEAFETNDFDQLAKKRKLIIEDFSQLQSFDLKRVMLDTTRIFNRILKPTGLSIVFLGPDGSGKSTIIDKLMQIQLPYRRKDYFHLKPFSQQDSKTTTIEDPHALPVYSSMKSYMKLLYFIYQYNIGWLKNIVKLKIKSSLIIFDRYYDDLLVDSKRYRYGGRKYIAKLARFFIPKPDLYFILTADPEVIYERKQEVPFEELKKQVQDYKALADNKRYFLIDVDKSPDEIVKEIVKIMMEKMNERY